MDYLPLHKKNQQDTIAQYLCTSSDELKNRVCMTPCKPWKKWQSDENEVHNDNNETMKIGRRIILALFHKPAGRTKMNGWHVIFDVWRSRIPQVQQNKEDIEEDVDAANNVQTEKEKKMRLMWMKCVNWRRRSSKYECHWYCVKTLRITSLSEQRSRWLKHEMRLIKMGMKGSVGKKIMKEEMENSNVITCCFQQSPWWRNKGKNAEEKRYHLTSTPYMPNVWLAYWGTSKLPHSICSKKAARKKIRTLSVVQSWNRTVSVMQSWNSTVYMVQSWNKEDKKIKMMKDEFSASYLTKKTRSKMTKDEFYAFYLKKKDGTPTKKMINWLLSGWGEECQCRWLHQCPHNTTIVIWGIMIKNKMIIIFSIKRDRVHHPLLD